MDFQILHSKYLEETTFKKVHIFQIATQLTVARLYAVAMSVRRFSIDLLFFKRMYTLLKIVFPLSRCRILPSSVVIAICVIVVSIAGNVCYEFELDSAVHFIQTGSEICPLKCVVF